MPPAEVIPVRDARSGLVAFIVLDDVTLGPAAGGVRTRRYPSEDAALADAELLARAMTLKCSIAGLDAGGGKAVVIDHAGLERGRAFEVLGDAIERLGGAFYTAGDLGTTADDLLFLASRTDYVRTDEPALASAVARGWLGCIDAAAQLRGTAVSRMRIAVQGCGAIGAAAAHAAAATGAELFVTDIDPARGFAVSRETGAVLVAPADVLSERVDVVAPCAIGGVIDATSVEQLRAWLVCGAANNILANEAAGRALVERGIAFVPDVIASAGGVIEGVGETIMQLPDRTGLLDALGETAREVLLEADRTGATPSEVAIARAQTRLRLRAG